MKTVNRGVSDKIGFTYEVAHLFIIELDGSQHLDRRDYDERRTKYLESLGYRVIRFWNNQVMKDIEGVLEVILQSVKQPT